MRASVVVTVNGEAAEARIDIQDLVGVFEENVEAAVSVARAKQLPTGWDWDQFNKDLWDQFQKMQKP